MFALMLCRPGFRKVQPLFCLSSIKRMERNCQVLMSYEISSSDGLQFQQSLKTHFLDRLKHETDASSLVEQLNSMSTDKKVTLTYLIVDILKAKFNTRRIVMNKGIIERYFDLIDNLARTSAADLPVDCLPNFLYRLSLLNAEEEGQVLEKIGVEKFANFTCVVLKNLSQPSRFLFIIVNALHKFLKNCQFPVTVDDLIRHENLRNQLIFHFKQMMAISGYRAMLFDHRNNSLILIYTLACCWKIKLSNFDNAEKFTYFLVDLFKNQMKFSVDTKGNLKLSRITNLIRFFAIVQTVDFGPNFSQSNIQNLNDIWLNFWLEKSLKAFQRPGSGNLTVSLAGNFLNVIIRNEKFEFFFQHEETFFNFLQQLSSVQKKTILETLKGFQSETSDEDAKRLVQQCAAILKA